MEKGGGSEGGKEGRERGEGGREEERDEGEGGRKIRKVSIIHTHVHCRYTVTCEPYS